MLRAVVVALGLANLVFWLWSAGMLQGLGWVPASERDPTRLDQQVRPDAVRVLLPSAIMRPMASTVAGVPQDAASVSSAPASELSSNAVTCLEAGPFAGAALENAERALAAGPLPESSWVRTSHEIGAQYAVVLGPFGNREAMQKKREEIGRLQLPFESLGLPGDAGAAAQPGFALGRYDTRGAAETALVTFTQRGVRTARVAMLQPPSSESHLRVENATPAQVAQLRALSGGAGGALGAGFAPCSSIASADPAAPSR
jgi:hypothetical protein